MFYHPNYDAIGQGEVYCVEWGRQLSGANLAANTRVDVPGFPIPHWMMVTAVQISAFHVGGGDLGTPGGPTNRCRINWGLRADVDRFRVIHTPDSTIADSDLLPMGLLGGRSGGPLYIEPTLFPQGSEVVWSIRPDIELFEVRITFFGSRVNPEAHVNETLAHRGYAGIAFTPLTCAATSTAGTPGPTQQTDFRLGARAYDFVGTSLSCFTEDTNGDNPNGLPLWFRMRSLYDERELVLPSPRFATTDAFGVNNPNDNAQSIATPFPGAGMLIPHNNGIHLEAHNRLDTDESIRGYWVLHGRRRVPVPQEQPK